MTVPLELLGMGGSGIGVGPGTAGEGTATAAPIAPPTLLGAIEQRFAASAYLPVEFKNGIWFGQEPENTEPPFCVVMHLGEVPTFNTESDVEETTKLQFQVFARDASEVERLSRLLKNRFDWCMAGIRVQNASCVKFERTNLVLAPIPEQRNKDGQVMHQGFLDFSIEMHWTMSLET